MTQSITELNRRIKKEAGFVQDLIKEVRRIIVGQDYLINRLLIALFTNGHVLIEGVPGLAKTLTVRTLSATLSTEFQRIQFTPDLLPADLIGTQIYNPKTGDFSPRLGPIFSNIILADEINRAPAKVQSALLEAMEERQVTIGETTYRLDNPFLVLATQNPVEQEGTYPLPEAQLDRFMLKVVITYPTRDEEHEIINRMAGIPPAPPQSVITPEDIIQARHVVDEIYVDEKIKAYALDIIFATREPHKIGMKKLGSLIEFGASPRGTLALIKASKAHAFLNGRGYVIPDDIKRIAPDVLRHRIVTSFEAQAENINSTRIIRKIINRIEVP